ncbi:2-(hydroxymethyl)glutarate dehydrogenase [Ensifer adhaerens]|nr:L-threonate dehydrogenase [Ensifer adhaerens]NRP21777.1 2-(hydroxymethyl)glutarate dehydrogenase [Ensifer adhaerens]
MSDRAQGEPLKVAVIGLGSMGFGMAESLLRAGFDVAGFDITDAARERLRSAGGTSGGSPIEVATGASVVVSVVVNARQTDEILFGDAGAIGGMPAGSVFISSATMSPTDAENLAAKAKERGVFFLDAPISGGAKRAAAGELTIMASGEPEAFLKSEGVLSALAQKVYRLGDRAGIGASVKMINQLLAGVHIAAACEAITLASKLGLDLRTVYEVITASAGNSWMFENRIPHVLDGDYRPLSSIEIFVKDLGIIQDMARSERYPAPIAAAALQMYLAAAGAGMGRDDDSSVARVYAQLSGAALPPSSVDL